VTFCSSCYGFEKPSDGFVKQIAAFIQRQGYLFDAYFSLSRYFFVPR
jgi:hypothetical protein